MAAPCPPPLLSFRLPTAGLGPDGQFLPGEMLPPSSTPEPLGVHHDAFGIPRSMAHHFNPALSPSLAHHHGHQGAPHPVGQHHPGAHHPHQQMQEMAGEVW